MNDVTIIHTEFTDISMQTLVIFIYSVSSKTAKDFFFLQSSIESYLKRILHFRRILNKQTTKHRCQQVDA